MADTPVTPPTPVVPTTAPNRNTQTDPLAYSQIADAWAGSLPAYNTYLEALGDNVEFNAQSAFDSASEALASAASAADDEASAAISAAEAAVSAASAIGAPGTSATSTTSNTISTGSKTFTVQTGKLFTPGQAIVVADVAAPATNYLFGQVTSYNSGTGELVLSVSVASGGGTLSDWIISISANPGASSPSIARIVRTSNTIITSANNTQLIDITSGTFTQTFDPAASLGDGFYCYVRNSGTGIITLDPNGAETIDGAATSILYPGETIIITCNGSSLSSVRISEADGTSYVRVNTGNGFGSTNTTVRRFTTTEFNVGTAVTYADSATLGATFTVNKDGLYEIIYWDAYSSAGGEVAITKNSAALTSAPTSIPVANLIAWSSQNTGNAPVMASATVYLLSGDVIRAQPQSFMNATVANRTVFSIRRLTHE